MNRNRISKSLIGTYGFCPYKAKLWLDKIPPTDPTAYAMERGKLIHDVFERFYKELDYEKAKSEKDIEPCFREAIQKVKPAALEDADKDLENFLEWNLERWEKQKDSFMPLHVEEKIYLEDEDIVGVIDRVDMENGKLRIIDYKSGYLGQRNISKFRFELSLYSHIYEKQYGQIPEIWGIYFSGDGKLIQESANHKYWERWGVKKVGKFVEAIRTDTFPRTEWTSGCQRCEYFSHCWR